MFALSRLCTSFYATFRLHSFGLCRSVPYLPVIRVKSIMKSMYNFPKIREILTGIAKSSSACFVVTSCNYSFAGRYIIWYITHGYSPISNFPWPHVCPTWGFPFFRGKSQVFYQTTGGAMRPLPYFLFLFFKFFKLFLGGGNFFLQHFSVFFQIRFFLLRRLSFHPPPRRRPVKGPWVARCAAMATVRPIETETPSHFYHFLSYGSDY